MPRKKSKTEDLSRKREKLSKEDKVVQISSPKGMHDILPPEQWWWDKLREASRKIAAEYNFLRIDTPVVEAKEIFEKGAGLYSDIVEKEMYYLKGKKGRELVLRPEGTAPVMRAYLQHGLGRLGHPVRLWYEGAMFRHENPQAGRYRQHHQVGFEIIGGVNDPIYDAQVIVLFISWLKQLKIKKFSLSLNSIGCRICRPLYQKQLQTYYRRYEDELCQDCKHRLKVNVLRILDCKKDKCREFKEEAPIFLDKLCLPCSRHFQGVLEYLDDLKIDYSIDNTLVRGLDYYNRTVFEFDTEEEAGTIIAGGRYDYLAEFLGGRLTPAVGGAAGYERIILLLKRLFPNPNWRPTQKVFVIYVGEVAKKKVLSVVEQLRAYGIEVGEAFGRESLRAQLKIADRSGAILALILGQREIHESSIILRDLKSGMQEVIEMDDLAEEVKKRLKRVKSEKYE